MKLNKIQRAMVCSALALSMPVTAITANALTNPASSGSQTATDLATKADGSKTTNPATSGGQTDIIGDIKAGNSTTTNPNSDVKTNPPAPVKNSDLEEAVKDCPLEESTDQAAKDAVAVATIQPDVDSLFNSATKAAQGCFAASSEVINLAKQIPDINVSGIGKATQTAINTIVENKLKEMKSTACAIADEALLSSLEPIKKYMDEYKGRVNEINGLVGNVGGLGGVNGGTSVGIIGEVLDEQIGATTSRIDQLGAETEKKQAGIKAQVESKIEQANKQLESTVNSIGKNLPEGLTNTITGGENTARNANMNRQAASTAPVATTNTTKINSQPITAEPTPKSSSSASSSTSSSVASSSSGSSASSNPYASPTELGSSKF